MIPASSPYCLLYRKYITGSGRTIHYWECGNTTTSQLTPQPSVATLRCSRLPLAACYLATLHSYGPIQL